MDQGLKLQWLRFGVWRSRVRV